MAAQLAVRRLVSCSSATHNRSCSEGKQAGHYRSLGPRWQNAFPRLGALAKASSDKLNLCIVYKIRGIGPVGEALDSVRGQILYAVPATRIRESNKKRPAKGCRCEQLFSLLGVLPDGAKDVGFHRKDLCLAGPVASRTSLREQGIRHEDDQSFKIHQPQQVWGFGLPRRSFAFRGAATPRG